MSASTRAAASCCFTSCFSPRKLVAIELNPAPLPPLADYVARHADAITVAWGVNQADFAALDRICTAEFGGEPLDLVVDDASHFYPETRATFRALFPRLRDGGMYIIEDWSWAHWRGELWQEQRGGAYFSDKEPLTNLLIELIMLCATSPEIVSRVNVTPAIIYVERGAAALAPGFELAAHYLARGEPPPLFKVATRARARVLRQPALYASQRLSARPRRSAACQTGIGGAGKACRGAVVHAGRERNQSTLFGPVTSSTIRVGIL